MSKADQSAVRKQTQAQIDANNTNMSGVNTQLQGILGTAQGNAAQLLPGITAGYSDISSSGGGSDPIAASTFADLSQTGGISDADATAMRNRAGEAATSAFAGAKDKAMRTAAATGGYGNTSGIQASLARQGSNAATQATEDTNASIAQLRQAGREAGATGLAQQRQNITQNRLQATGGLTNVYGMNENQVNATVDAILRNFQQTGTMNNQDLAILTNLANQPGVLDKIMQYQLMLSESFKNVGQGIGAAGSAIGGAAAGG